MQSTSFSFQRVVKQLSEHHLTQKSMFSQALQRILIFLALLPPPCKYIQKSGLYIHELAFGWLQGLHVPVCDKSISKGTTVSPPDPIPTTQQEEDRGCKVTVELLFWSPHPALLKRRLIYKQRFHSCGPQQAKNSSILTMKQIQAFSFSFFLSFFFSPRIQSQSG